MSKPIFRSGRRTVRALDSVLADMEDLSWDQKRRVLRWACDELGIDPMRLLNAAS
jgi:hypothetical protein